MFALIDGADQRTLRVKGRYKGAVVGFEVRLGPAWKEGRLGDVNLTTYQGTVVISRRATGRKPEEQRFTWRRT